MKQRITKQGFTLIELLVVIAIIGILSTLAIIALGSARQKARDSKRVADINQISKALELCYSDNNSYPTIITPGQPISFGSTTYLSQVPSNPAPRTDGDCSSDNYTYAPSSDNKVGYTLNFCLGSATGSLAKGLNYASQEGPNGDPTLVGWWKLDEGTGTTASDSSQGGNGAVFPGGVNDPLWVTGRTSSVSKALSFDNSNDYIQVAHKANQLLVNGGTLSAWIKPTSSGTFGRIIDKSTSAGGANGFVFYMYSDKIRLLINAGTVLISTNTVTLGSWSMVTATWDASGSATLYINGVANGTGAISSPAGITSSGVLRMGNSAVATTSPFDGSMADVRMYNRPLSASEILALYNATQ